MDPVNLGYPVEQSGQNWQPLIDLIRHYAVPIAIGVGAWVIVCVIAYRWTKRQPHEPTDERATLRGTAQVLSFKKTRGTDWASIRWYPTVTGGIGAKPKRNARYWCIIKLAVRIPGREQYATVVRKPLGPAERAAVRPGMAVQVRVDPDDDPKNVRIDLNEPVPPLG
jgi:hypothetical protein